MRRAGLVVVIVVTILTGCGSGHHLASPDLSTVKVTTFDGKAETLATYAGRPLVVNFWASWCGPCKTELPTLQAVHADLGQSVTFLGVDTNDTVADGEALAHQAGLTYQLVRDTRGTAVTRFTTVGMPFTVLISPSGKVVAIKLGAFATVAELRHLIATKLST